MWTDGLQHNTGWFCGEKIRLKLQTDMKVLCIESNTHMHRVQTDWIYVNKGISDIIPALQRGSDSLCVNPLS